MQEVQVLGKSKRGWARRNLNHETFLDCAYDLCGMASRIPVRGVWKILLQAKQIE